MDRRSPLRSWQTSINRVTAFPGDFVLNEPSFRPSRRSRSLTTCILRLPPLRRTSRCSTTCPFDSDGVLPSGRDAQFRLHPMAAGPYKFGSQQLNVNMIFDRFDGFWTDEDSELQDADAHSVARGVVSPRGLQAGRWMPLRASPRRDASNCKGHKASGSSPTTMSPWSG